MMNDCRLLMQSAMPSEFDRDSFWLFLFFLTYSISKQVQDDILFSQAILNLASDITAFFYARNDAVVVIENSFR